MNYRIFQKLILFGLLSITLVSAQAATGGTSTGSGGGSGSGKDNFGINNLVGGYGVDQLYNTKTALFNQSPDAPFNTGLGTLVNNLLNPSLAAPVVKTIKVELDIGNTKYKYQNLGDFTTTDLYRMLTSVNPALNTQAMALLPGPFPISQQVLQQTNLPNQPSIPFSASTASYDLNSLLLPLQYDNSTMSSNALNFIQFAGQVAQMPNTLDLSRLSAADLRKALYTNSDLQAYLVAQRSIAASQSVALSNLYFSYGERIPQDTTSLANTIPELNKSSLYPKASSLQIEHYLATRRYDDPAWVKNIQQLATPAELQRQNIYLLRDLLYVTYRKQLVEERMLAALSALESNSLTMQQTNLQQLLQKVQNEKPFSAGTGSNNRP